MIDRCGRSLQKATRFPDLIVKLLGEASLTEYESERLGEFLRTFASADTLRLAPQIESVAPKCHRRDSDLTDDLLQILSEARAWSAAENVAVCMMENLEDTRWNQWQRVQAGLRRLAARAEKAASEGRLDILPELQNQWTALAAQSARYEQEAAERPE